MPRKRTTSQPPAANQISIADLQNVLVMQLEDASAIVMLSPALRSFREAVPDAEITLMTSAAGSQVVPLLSRVDHVMIDRAVGRDRPSNRAINPREDVAMIERLRRANFSTALIFSNVSQSPWRAAYACYLAGIPYRVGFTKGMEGPLLSHFLQPLADDAHQVDRNLYLLESIGVPAADSQVRFDIPETVENGAGELLARAGVKPDIPYIVFAPGSEGMISPYAPDHFAAVAHILAAQTGQQLVVVGSQAEAKSMQPVLRVANENLYGNIFSLVEMTTLPELAAIIRRASLTIANPSVSMHLADAFGCPMVILHSDSDKIDRCVPRTSPVRLLRRPGTYPRMDRSDSLSGMNNLDVRPEEVAVAALEMLAEQTYSQADYQGLFGYKIESDLRWR